jgi:AraC-like DNA-binding protein
MALVVASDFSGREMELYHLGRLGIDGVIRTEAGLSGRDVLTVVDRALSAAVASRVLSAVGDDLPPLIQETIRWAIEHAETRPQVSELAAAVAMSSRVLRRELRAFDQMRPRDLLLWGRLIRASYLLERPSETVESVAFRLGYATGGALGKALKHHFGCSPTDLIGRGGLAWAMKALHQRGLRPTNWENEREAQPWRRRWNRTASPDP